MPKYELCYILAAQVSDDQVPVVSGQIKQIVENFGGSDITEEQLGKKKLAYPIKKTRNGTYIALRFTMPANKIADLEAKIRTQTATIIRHLIINLDEHLDRLAKDQVEQAKLSRLEADQAAATPSSEMSTSRPAAMSAPKQTTPAPEPITTSLTAADLDEQIEAALTEDIVK